MDSMPDAYPHSKIHSGKYYLNVEYLLEDTIAEGLGHRGIIETLRDVAEDLKIGVFSINSSLTAAG